MTRRRWCIVVASLPAAMAGADDPAREAWDVIANAARALAGGNASEFLSSFDRAMPDYQALRANVTALVAEAEVQSSIDPIRNEGDDRSRLLELDWLLRFTPRGTAAAQTERRQNITCRLVRQGKKWRVAAFEPVAFLSPRSPP